MLRAPIRKPETSVQLHNECENCLPLALDQSDDITRRIDAGSPRRILQSFGPDRVRANVTVSLQGREDLGAGITEEE